MNMQFDGEPGDVSAILLAILNNETVTFPDPGEKLDEAAVVVVEQIPIALLEHRGGESFDVRFLACYAPAHGSHPRHEGITAQLAQFNDRQNQNVTCPICDGKKWLPAERDEAKTAAAFAVSLGIFRGVRLPESDELNASRSEALEKAFSNVLDNPLVTRIRAELERRQTKEDDKG